MEAVWLLPKPQTSPLPSTTPCLRSVVPSEVLSSTSLVPSGHWLLAPARSLSVAHHTIATRSSATNGISFLEASLLVSVLVLGMLLSPERSCRLHHLDLVGNTSPCGLWRGTWGNSSEEPSICRRTTLKAPLAVLPLILILRF